MFDSVQFKNYRILKDALLPLKPFTLILGPNGSGKSTAVSGIAALNTAMGATKEMISAGVPPAEPIEITASWAADSAFVGMRGVTTKRTWRISGSVTTEQLTGAGKPVDQRMLQLMDPWLKSIRVYNATVERITPDVGIDPNVELAQDGSNLAAVLDRIRDEAPERFDAINEELGRWLPEFDRILFFTPQKNLRTFALRTRQGRFSIPPPNLSQGTLLSLMILTIAYMPNPPALVCLEEPDRGIHPRLLREVRDALYRLSYPKEMGEDRPSTQVVATTHSPYFLDLFRDRIEEVVLSEKLVNSARFVPLTDHQHLAEILQDTALSDAWYSGVLGGVPANS